MFAHNALPGYKTSSHILTQHQLALTPAELHGLVSGLICGGMRGERLHCYLRDLANDGKAFTPPLLEMTNTLGNYVDNALNNGGFLFDVFLPEGRDVSVFDRAKALAGWVNHFLLGIGVAQPQIENLQGDPAEALADLQQIAKLDYDTHEDPEDVAASLEEVIEFVRLAAVLYHDTFCYSLQTTFDSTRRIIH